MPMLEFIGEIDDAISKKDNQTSSVDYNPRLDHRTPYRNLYLAVVSNAFDQLFEPLSIEVKATTGETEKLTHIAKPKTLNLKWDYKVINCMDYQVAYRWFMSGEKDHVFDFITCCSAIRLNLSKIKDRVVFINECRDRIIREIAFDTDGLKDIVRENNNILHSLKVKYRNKPGKSEYTIVESVKKTIEDRICEEYEKKYGINPSRRDDTKDKAI